MKTFKAYDVRGNLMLSTWTNSPGTFLVEKAAYQARLNRGELASVEITSDEPHFITEHLHMQVREGRP